MIADSDADGLLDGDEVNVYHSNPLVADNEKLVFVQIDNGANAVAPYSTIATAATSIQDALQYADDDYTIFVGDGHYLLDAEILVTKQVSIQSVNGPEATIIDGQGSIRCFNLGESACTLSGLTITNGFSTLYGLKFTLIFFVTQLGSCFTLSE